MTVAPLPRAPRADLQGVRAIAVVSVVVNHLTGWPVGGYLGVDVFFVLSGYLITRMLVRDLDRYGRFRPGWFYGRRVRRLLPAALLTLAVTVAAAWRLVAPSVGRTTAVDAAWAAGFAANWHFMLQQTDYFADRGTASPLQHFWSLSVEEQFYLAWPFLVWAIVALLRPRLRSARARTTWAGAGVAVLFCLAWGLTSQNPGAAYFSTFARLWELAAGGFLVVLEPHVRHLSPRSSRLLAGAGVFGILVSMLIVGPSRAFPAPLGASVVASTMAVIAAGCGGTQLLGLCVRPITYIGDISYSVYLWHLPVIILLPYLFGASSGPEQVTAAVLIFAASIVSYHLVENPIRTGRPPRRSIAIRVTAAATVLIVVAGASTYAGHRGLLNVFARPAYCGGIEPATVDLSSQEKVAQAIRGSLCHDELPPDLSPSLDELASRTTWYSKPECQHPSTTPPEACTFGDPSWPEAVYVVGDSMAESWLPALAAGFNAHHVRVRSLAMIQCPYVTGRLTTFQGAANDDCMAHNAWVDTVLQQDRPSLVVASFSEDEAGNLIPTPTNADQGLERLVGASRARLSPLAAAGLKVVLLPAPPRSKPLPQCASSGHTLACARSVNREYTLQARLSAADASVRTVDVSPWFCDAGGLCPAVVGKMATHADGKHPTAVYSSRLGAVSYDAITRLR